MSAEIHIGTDKRAKSNTTAANMAQLPRLQSRSDGDSLMRKVTDNCNANMA